ncbi:1-acyl-sn-glycerol-3-phosphate acyltransferase [Aurantibacter crassamenti]|uniref:lysophospholipid acyltransferase family protein n=1 Tax=Aurantibacter crassamenti TaxID=1837375 RepID=UPI001939766E|nr:1-acyl-sn-glycerol-3-phosphate acyltransferase [Aurantibacter crassamenti]MBM1107027.1 1-acyl-sn-glycerol-3-phosphate acyltransferase [Aurantibacter crassamenti]
MVKFSSFYTKVLISIFFGGIKYSGHYEEKGLPILIISNHFSFYDGFIQILLNLKVFKRRLHFMMLEKELRKNIWLTKIGACSISKGKRSSLESLEYAVEVLEDPENLFLFFPQGKIQSLYTREFTFEKGLLSNILENKKREFQLVFNINLIKYGTNIRPVIYAYYETQHITAETDAEAVEIAFNRFAKACFTKQGA